MHVDNETSSRRVGVYVDKVFRLLDLNGDLVLEVVKDPLPFALLVVFEAGRIDLPGIRVLADHKLDVDLLFAIELTCFL